MKRRLLGVLILSGMLWRCTTTQYSPAEKHLELKDYSEAIRAYLRLLDPHTRDGKRYIYYDREAVTGVGVVYWHMQRYETAEKILRMVVDKDPFFGKALFYLGASLEAMGREDEAIDVYRRYTAVPSSDPYSRVLLGRMDWVVKRKIAREVQLALQSEAQLNVADLPEKSIAVLYFLSLSEDPQWKPLQKGLAEIIITDLSQAEELKVIERLRVNRIMEELRLSTTGLMDENTTPRVGKLLGTRNMLKGSYMVMPDLRMTMDAGIYQTDKALLPTTSNFEGNLSRLFRMEKELVLRIFDYFDIELTPQQRERILKIPTENMMAFMSYCRGLDALDEGNFEKAQEYFDRALKLDVNFEIARDQSMSAQIWEATHNRNLIRVDHEVAQLIKTTPKGRAEMVYRPPPPLVSPWNRLQWMGAHQSAGFIPGNDARKSLQEAEINGVQLLPRDPLEPPPPPPNK